MSSKLNTLAKNSIDFEIGNKNDFIEGFYSAFQIIDEELAKECNKLETHSYNGERLMTLKIYKARIANILVEMEKNYE